MYIFFSVYVFIMKQLVLLDWQTLCKSKKKKGIRVQTIDAKTFNWILTIGNDVVRHHLWRWRGPCHNS